MDQKKNKVFLAVFIIIFFIIFLREYWIDYQNIQIYKNLTDWQKKFLIFMLPLLVKPKFYNIDRELKSLRILSFYAIFQLMVIGSENLANCAFYFALTLPYLVLVLKNILSTKKYIHSWFLIISIIIFAFFSVDLPEILSLIMLLILPIILIYKEFFFTKINDKKSLNRQLSGIIVSIFLFCSFWFYINQTWQIIYLLSSIFIYRIILNSQNFKRYYFFAINLVIIVIVFMFMGNYFRSIFNNYFSQEINEIEHLKSPNNYSDNINTISSQFNIKNSENIILSPYINHFYPLKIEHNWRNENTENNIEIIKQFQNYLLISSIAKNIDYNFFYKLISNPNKRLIVVYNDNYMNSKSCKVGILEELWKDSKIREYFNTNFNFFTQIFDIQENSPFTPNYTQEFLNDKEFEIIKQIDLKQTKYTKYNVFEIYIRK